MSDKYKVSDFVDIDNCDMIHMCKRKNNQKRDFLFVNENQGKHVPVKPSKVYELVEQLYKLSYMELANKSNILVVGFAETATVLGEIYFEYARNAYNGLPALDVSEFVTTTREVVNGLSVPLYFSEEHSHATEQKLYVATQAAVNTVVFIEDEITTGKTILNLVNQLKVQYTDIKNFYVVSVCNWQTSSYKEMFEENNIKAISLYHGTLKSMTDKLDLDTDTLKIYDTINCTVVREFEGRAVTVREFICSAAMESTNNNLVMDVVSYILEHYKIKRDDVIEIIGTEEFMGLPLKIARILENCDCNVYFHATTRSPIVVSKDCIISDGAMLSSAYDSDRKTYLYDMDTIDSNYVFIFTDCDPSANFVEEITKLYINQGVELSNIVIFTL